MRINWGKRKVLGINSYLVGFGGNSSFINNKTVLIKDGSRSFISKFLINKKVLQKKKYHFKSSTIPYA